MEIAYPFRVNSAGRTSEEKGADHLRDLIEQVLFTTPGERVNQPDFGTGLLQFVFAGEDDETLAAAQFMIRGSLQRWLGDLIEVDTVAVTTEDATLYVTVVYRVLSTRQVAVAEFQS